MDETQKIGLLFAGGMLLVFGLGMMVFRNDRGRNRVKIFGAEFDLSTPSLVVVLLGAASFAAPLMFPSPPQQASGQSPAARDLSPADKSVEIGPAIDGAQSSPAIGNKKSAVPSTTTPKLEPSARSTEGCVAMTAPNIATAQVAQYSFAGGRCGGTIHVIAHFEAQTGTHDGGESTPESASLIVRNMATGENLCPNAHDRIFNTAQLDCTASLVVPVGKTRVISISYQHGGVEHSSIIFSSSASYVPSEN